MTTARSLASQYQLAHNQMRNADGLQPQEALDELLKYVFFKERDEAANDPIGSLEPGTLFGATEGDVAEIRERFSRYLAASAIIPPRWRDDGILLSDAALAKVHAVFADTTLSKIGLDLRSSALRVFLNGSVRKGLGIFLTPDEVVREVVAALNPKVADHILDPACGSGTFLYEAAQHVHSATVNATAHLYGVDKNPRMMQLAEFNCGHLDQIQFNRAVTDSLARFDAPGSPAWYAENSFDMVLTNPPFGVTLDKEICDLSQFDTCEDGGRQGSEIIFLERALQVLKPGGTLGIVLPRSVITNQRMVAARAALGRYGFVKAMITLPAETFAATGTQTTTVVLIAQKFEKDARRDATVTPLLVRIENVGFDSTGRFREGSELVGLGAALRSALETGKPSVSSIQILDEQPAKDTFANLEAMLGTGRRQGQSNDRKLRDLLECATIGATPARSAYADSGLFLVKVGNLSGSGINWIARDRNYVAEGSKRHAKRERQLQPGDLLLTSSAHASRYIGKKVDIVTMVPEEVGGRASYVGEVMLLRPSTGVDPYRLLAYMRSPATTQAMQDRVRGQTAHLYPEDVLDLELDEELWQSELLTKSAALNRRQAELNDELNQLAFEQARLEQQSVQQPGLAEVLSE